ncbi:MAG: molecular chaperone HtpG [Rhodospirillales bacterium]|nr:molecular chaperone HtpG [Rhodospirillales bacterium]
MAQETFTFQTEVGRLLDIVAHSLYSHKEIFLRELISNASDACDRLRYAALTNSHLMADDAALEIRLDLDRSARTLTVADSGIGMDRDELIETLGTIARSGSQAFLAKLTGDAKKDVSLIGQFGVGFYSAYMVADRVDVLTRKAGDAQAWLWSSDGKGAFTIEEAERVTRGTTVTLHLNAEADEFLEESRLRQLIKTYSDHIGVAIVMGEGDERKMLNAASSLWTLAKKEITPDQYKEFYHHVSHAFDDPWIVVHNSVEGVISYINLLFVPKEAPLDLFDNERKGRLKLYVKRVFITDDCEGLVPAYLRFLRGVVDSEDLPLNISRENFQHDPRMAKIRGGLVKRVLDELAKKADDAPDEYAVFWDAFGAVLKEGIYEDFENRDRLLSLARFRSTATDAITSLDAYLERMKPEQEAIYIISGGQLEALRRSPQLEGFKAKGVEVLLLTDPIDEFWIPMVRTYKDKPFKSAAGADADLSKIASLSSPDDPAGTEAAPHVPSADVDRLVGVLKSVLADAVKDVRVSTRLTESAVCLVAAEGDMDMYLERLLRQHRKLEADSITARILEINPGHPLIARMAERASGDDANASLSDAAWLLLDQARIIEGDPLPDPAAFAHRLTAIMTQGLGTPGI